MWKALGKYSLLSFTSFCLSTLALHSVANAQSYVSPLPEHGSMLIPPTPTPVHPVLRLQQDILTELKTITPTPTPTDTPTPTPTEVPTAAPTQAPVSVNSNPGGLNADTLFSMVNSHRQSMGLPAFQKDDKTCQLAQSRAPEVGNEIASGNMHAGLESRNLPYWNTENIISMNSEAAAFNWWLNDDIHRRAIEGNFTYSCVACSGNSCAEEFTNYQSK